MKRLIKICIMDFLIFLIFFFTLFSSVLCFSINDTNLKIPLNNQKNDSKINEEIISTTIESESDKQNVNNICDLCHCTGDLINCTDIKIGEKYKNTTWPKTNLKSVIFCHSEIARIESFPNVKIDKLIMSHNKVVKIDDAAFKFIDNLVELDLSHNYLTADRLKPDIFKGAFAAEAFEPLLTLKVLNLGYNNFHTLHQDIFEHIPDLSILILSGNPFGKINQVTAIALNTPYYLRELYLEYCDLKELPDIFHNNQKNLKIVSLKGNKFSMIPSALEDAKSLEYLNLDENPLKVLGNVNVFPKLSLLKQINLNSLTELKQIKSGVFAGLKSLEVLSISNCPQLTNIHEHAFILNEPHSEASIIPLKKLNLSNNNLKYLPENLLIWDQLVELDLSNNSWVCDCDNEYLVNYIDYHFNTNLSCSSPPEYKGTRFTYLEGKNLRCLDLYSARPELDAPILVGLLIGVLLFIPIVLSLFLIWRRGFIFYGKQGPGSFSRAFYKRTSNSDEYY